MYNYSVIIPYRDKYELLCKAVNSIPDRCDIQIIIVDNSLEPLPQEKIPQKHKAYVLFTTSSPTKGAGCARNTGLSFVKGKFVVFLDADDFFTVNAFTSFDKYLDQDYDIVFFEADSIHLTDGTPSTRHENIHGYIQKYLKTGDEGPLRYRYVNPVAKMIRREVITAHNIQFEETRVSNDAMFSVKTGHYAKKIMASNDVVYIITEGEKGASLTKSRSAENMYIRYQVAVRRYQFITSVGREDQRPELFGYARFALFHFGPKEFIRYWRYARQNNVSLFIK